MKQIRSSQNSPRNSFGHWQADFVHWPPFWHRTGGLMVEIKRLIGTSQFSPVHPEWQMHWPGWLRQWPCWHLSRQIAERKREMISCKKFPMENQLYLDYNQCLSSLVHIEYHLFEDHIVIEKKVENKNVNIVNHRNSMNRILDSERRIHEMLMKNQLFENDTTMMNSEISMNELLSTWLIHVHYLDTVDHHMFYH